MANLDFPYNVKTDAWLINSFNKIVRQSPKPFWEYDQRELYKTTFLPCMRLDVITKPYLPTERSMYWAVGEKKPQLINGEACIIQVKISFPRPWNAMIPRPTSGNIKNH